MRHVSQPLPGLADVQQTLTVCNCSLLCKEVQLSRCLVLSASGSADQQHYHSTAFVATAVNLPGNVYTAGHSLGGFTAASCCILDERILHAVTFESPGLTTFYHKLAGEIGNEQYWQVRLTGPPGVAWCFDAKRGSNTRKATSWGG